MNKLKAWAKETGSRIYFHRHRHKLTQRVLARRVGISASQLGSIEQGIRMPSVDLLFQLAEALEVVPSQLVPNPEKDHAAVQVALIRLAEEFALNDEQAYPSFPASPRRAVSLDQPRSTNG